MSRPARGARHTHISFMIQFITGFCAVIEAGLKPVFLVYYFCRNKARRVLKGDDDSKTYGRIFESTQFVLSYPISGSM